MQLNFLKTDLDEKNKKLLRDNILKENIRRGRILAWFSIGVETLYATIGIAGMLTENDPRFRYLQYLAMYAFLITFNIAFLVFAGRIRHKVLSKNQKKHARSVILIYVTLVMGWGSMVSLMDQRLYGQLIVFIVNMITCSVIFYLEIKEIVVSYAVAIVILTVGLPFFQKSSDMLIGHYANISFFCLISFLASRLIFHSYSSDFKSKQQLQESKLELEKQIEQNRFINQQLSKANLLLKELSLVDELTGIPNRRSFRDFVDKMLANSTDKNLQCSVIIIDIDYFKSFNDRYGHLAGDHVLNVVAAKINSAVRDSNEFAARWGGDEFIFATFGIHEKEAGEIAQNLLKMIQTLEVSYEELSFNISVSIGVFTKIINAESDIVKIIDQADKALYHAKSKGRNCVVKFD